MRCEPGQTGFWGSGLEAERISMETVIQLDGQVGHLGAGSSEKTASVPWSWESLYEALGERVFRLLHRLTGDADEAADLTHDAFVRIHDLLIDSTDVAPSKPGCFGLRRTSGEMRCGEGV